MPEDAYHRPPMPAHQPDPGMNHGYGGPPPAHYPPGPGGPPGGPSPGGYSPKPSVVDAQGGSADTARHAK